MKILKTILAVALLSLSATTVSAQEVEYQFQPHMYLDLQGGAQYTLGEAKFKDLISPNVQIGLGYQFSPVIGLRLQANAWQSKGGWCAHRTAIGAPVFTADYKYKYVAPGLDLSFNLSNLICGWNPKRVFNLSAFLGAGANIAWDNGEVNDIAAVVKNLDAYNLEYLWDGTKVNVFGRGGVQLSFRLSDAVNFMIEGNANILSDKYNSKKTDNADWYFNVLGGLRFNLGNTYTKTLPPPPAPEPVPVVNPEPQPDPAILELQRQLKQLQEEKDKVEPLRRDVFFLINKTDIRESEAQKVKEIAYYLVKYPNTRVVVTGYADAGTGNDKINDRLAAQRADAVVKALQQQYGIESSRISYDSKGSRVQPFSDNDMNRVSICIAE